MTTPVPTRSTDDELALIDELAMASEIAMTVAEPW
jgi:hypothetical protein